MWQAGYNEQQVDLGHDRAPRRQRRYTVQQQPTDPLVDSEVHVEPAQVQTDFDRLFGVYRVLDWQTCPLFVLVIGVPQVGKTRFLIVLAIMHLRVGLGQSAEQSAGPAASSSSGTGAAAPSTVSLAPVVPSLSLSGAVAGGSATGSGIRQFIFVTGVSSINWLCNVRRDILQLWHVPIQRCTACQLNNQRGRCADCDICVLRQELPAGVRVLHSGDLSRMMRNNQLHRLRNTVVVWDECHVNLGNNCVLSSCFELWGLRDLDWMRHNHVLLYAASATPDETAVLLEEYGPHNAATFVLQPPPPQADGSPAYYGPEQLLNSDHLHEAFPICVYQRHRTCFDSFSASTSDTTLLQGFIGRIFGRDKMGKIHVWSRVSTVRNYVAYVRNGYSLRGVDWVGGKGSRMEARKTTRTVVVGDNTTTAAATTSAASSSSNAGSEETPENGFMLDIRFMRGFRDDEVRAVLDRRRMERAQHATARTWKDADLSAFNQKAAHIWTVLDDIVSKAAHLGSAGTTYRGGSGPPYVVWRPKPNSPVEFLLCPLVFPRPVMTRTAVLHRLAACVCALDRLDGEVVDDADDDDSEMEADGKEEKVDEPDSVAPAVAYFFHRAERLFAVDRGDSVVIADGVRSSTVLGRSRLFPLSAFEMCAHADKLCDDYLCAVPPSCMMTRMPAADRTLFVCKRRPAHVSSSSRHNGSEAGSGNSAVDSRQPHVDDDGTDGKYDDMSDDDDSALAATASQDSFVLRSDSAGIVHLCVQVRQPTACPRMSHAELQEKAKEVVFVLDKLADDAGLPQCKTDLNFLVSGFRPYGSSHGVQRALSARLDYRRSDTLHELVQAYKATSRPAHIARDLYSCAYRGDELFVVRTVDDRTARG